MWGNTPLWDGIKRQSGCYVTFYEKYINFEKRLASSWLTFLFPFLLIFSKFIRRKRTRHWLKIMLDLEQSFKLAPPWENLSKTVNPAGFRASDPFPKVGVARCKVWLMESDNAMSLSAFQFPGVLSQPHGRYAPYQRGVRCTFCTCSKFCHF